MQCLGKTADSALKNYLNNLRSRIHDAGSEKNEFNQRFNELYRMADGQICNVNSAATVAQIIFK